MLARSGRNVGGSWSGCLRGGCRVPCRESPSGCRPAGRRRGGAGPGRRHHRPPQPARSPRDRPPLLAGPGPDEGRRPDRLGDRPDHVELAVGRARPTWNGRQATPGFGVDRDDPLGGVEALAAEVLEDRRRVDRARLPGRPGPEITPL